MQAVSGEYIYRKERFTVIQGTRSATIYTIQPNRGPEGTISTITGRYLGSLNIDGLEIDSKYLEPQRSISGEGVMTLEYKGTSSEEVIGVYRESPVTSVEKTIKVIIGPEASIFENSSFTPEMDRIQVRINDDTDEGNPVKDVVVETTTVVTTIIKENEDGDEKIVEKTYTFTERAELPEGYTYIPRSIKPEVQKVVPDEIHVVKTGSNGDEHYILPQDLMIAIYGKNFTISRYAVGDETRVSYPIIKFGDVAINKNDNPAIELFVMDDSGNIMDGTPGNESGAESSPLFPELPMA